MRIAGVFNHKIKKGIVGREDVFEQAASKVAKFDKQKTTIWFHSSSLGEFEQAKPIIEKLQKTDLVNIFVTFFSPSGYDNSIKYPHADAVTYLPLDSPANARKFVKIINPSLAVFMRYDIWYKIFIFALEQSKVPVFLVDATMRSNSKRMNPFLRPFHTMLYRKFDYILTISDLDLKNFLSFDLDPKKVLKSGDTRFDRVYERALIARERRLIRDEILAGKKVVVAGSIWQEDEEVLLPAVKKLLKYYKDVVVILVPHEPTLPHLEKLENEFTGLEQTIRFSFLNSYNNERIILVDSIGILMALYYYANLAFVGEVLSQMYTTLEPAVYGIPVIYGPKNGQFARSLESSHNQVVV
ncbi:glycosyltransferase N-terminal domain-containing protein [Ignavibacteriales bacterium]